ncbi:hypothetical protein ACHQM5_005753 [Ranunculus cassubicifolius]
MAKETSFGINIGTKNSYLTVLVQGSHTPKLIKKFPSEVVVTNQVDKSDINPQDYFPGFLCLLGREFDDPIVQKEKGKVPYKIVKGPEGAAWVETSYGKQCSPYELLEKLVLKIKRVAVSCLGGTHVPTYVIALPCRLLSSQWMEWMKMLFSWTDGKEVLVVHEFSAAAASYGLHKRRGVFAIVDIGARTLDITLFISPLDDAHSKFTLRGLPQRDLYLGGDDFDDVILKYLVSEFKSVDGSDLVEDERLRKAAEEAKIALSSSTETEINLPNIITDPSKGSRDLNIRLTREKFESLAGKLTKKIKELCEKCLNKADTNAKDLEDVILVGGMANVPMVRRVVAEVLGRVPMRGVNNEEASALGTAMAVEAQGCVGINMKCVDL